MDRILGVAIGIATVCLVFSILASHLQEIWASFSARRAAALEVALEHMLGDPRLSTAFLAHPLIQAISFSPTRGLLLRRGAPTQPRPSYVGSDLFTKVLQAVLVSTHDLKAKDLPAIVSALPDSALKSRIATVTSGIESDVQGYNSAVEKWYDDTMDRINGLYKRNTQIVLLFLGFFLAVVCNANLLQVGQTLWMSAAARDELSAVAQIYSCKDSANCTARDKPEDFNNARRDLEALPIGYKDGDFMFYWRGVLHDRPATHLREWAFNLGGWMLTAIAVSLGAPFWFDLINKLINVRLVGQKPATAQKLKDADGSAAASSP